MRSILPAVLVAVVFSAISGVLYRDYRETEHDLAMALALRELTFNHAGSTTSVSVPPQAKTAIKQAVKKQPSSVSSPSTANNVNCISTLLFHEQFLCYLNYFRAVNAKPALRYEGALSTAASFHASWMASQGTLSHTGDGGSKFFERCRAVATTCSAENIAMGFTSAKHLFEIWEASPPHRATMLGNYSVIGLGTSESYAATLFR